jgi:hypothetical protein
MGATTHTLCTSEDCREHNRYTTHWSHLCDNRQKRCELATIFGLETHSYRNIRAEIIKYLRYRLLSEDKPARGKFTPLIQKTDKELEAQIIQYIQDIVASNEGWRGLYYFLRSYGVEPYDLLRLQDAAAQQFDSHHSTVNDKVIKYLKKNIGGDISHDITTKELKLAVIEYVGELLHTPLYHIDFAHFHR